MLDFLQYDFIVRGLIAGVAVALIAPVIGIFLVLRRYSLIADTLSHVSLAGIALGLLVNINPLLTALGATILSSTLIEKLRGSKKVYGESALALFLSGSLALAVVLIGLSNGFNATLFNYLFGSIATVSANDVVMVLFLGLIVLLVIGAFFKELFYISFDEESAQVSGIPVKFINTVFIVLTAIVISLSIPIVGILLISALLVVPVVSALLFKKSFLPTILLAQLFSVLSVIIGIISSYYLNLPPGGAIVLTTLLFFLISEIVNG